MITFFTAYPPFALPGCFCLLIAVFKAASSLISNLPAGQVLGFAGVDQGSSCW
jgi:hypothetical protein